MTPVLVVVVALRLLVPLGIPRHPLPFLLAALVLDAADQTVFQHLGGLPEDYQRYDKALDVYYLTVTYAAVLRNWTDPTAMRVARFLWYYRLVGTVLFETTDVRWLLLAFPNTFEYVVIAYEVVRLRWDPRRLTRRTLLVLAASIWVVVKIPQELWLHVLELDVTDEVAARPWVLLPLAVLAAALVAAALRLRHRLPPEDWPATTAVDDHLATPPMSGLPVLAWRSRAFAESTAEKVVLVALVTVVFIAVLDVRATTTQVVGSVVVFVVLNAVLSQLFVRHGARWMTTLAQFTAMAGTNAVVVLVLTLLRPRLEADADPGDTLFLVLLTSLVVTLYDRYRTRRALRLHEPEAAPTPRGARPRPAPATGDVFS
ncbi:hypothetical protein WDZ17_15110 [Pseudokineococcus basanitobsidens]|uniref:CDP-alcohol phosphatidyltransferase n=1 Tax=Pseudokineococcus basanitobsidens TaxID=1926649 RepID=A0ABU8RNL7_9ACTN